MSGFINSLIASTLLLSCVCAATDTAPSSEMIQLQHAAHVCNDEQEAKRLAANDHLREMAKALVEFKPTKYCFILPPGASVQLLERHASYIKFDYKSQILFTFGQYVQAEAIAQNH